MLGFVALPLFEPLQEVDLKHLFENNVAASFSLIFFAISRVQVAKQLLKRSSRDGANMNI